MSTLPPECHEGWYKAGIQGMKDRQGSLATSQQATVALLYHSDEGDVIASLFWDSARAFKATIK